MYLLLAAATQYSRPDLAKGPVGAIRVVPDVIQRIHHVFEGRVGHSSIQHEGGLGGGGGVVTESNSSKELLAMVVQHVATGQLG